MHMPYIFKIVAGPVGSSVTLKFARAQQTANLFSAEKIEYEYAVTLRRSVPEGQNNFKTLSLSPSATRLRVVARTAAVAANPLALFFTPQSARSDAPVSPHTANDPSVRSSRAGHGKVAGYVAM